MARGGVDVPALLLAVATVCVVAPAAAHVGRAFQRLRLPLITGYLVTGLACGPHFLALLQPHKVAGMWVLEHVCLSIIALAAGSELHVAELLGRSRKAVLFVTAGISLFTWVFVYATFVAFAPYIELTRDLSFARIMAMASLTATLMIARSPASCIAVLREMDARGPFSSLVLAVTVVKDIVVVVLFAVNVELCNVAFVTEGEEGGTGEVTASELVTMLLRPCATLAAAIGMGVLGGMVLLGTLRLVRRAPPRIASAATAASVCAATGCIFLMADVVDLEGLLVCLVAGVFAANRPSERGQGEREELHRALEGVIPFNNTLFFTLVGTSLRLGSLATTFRVAVLLFAVRLVAIYCGTLAGAWLGGLPSEHRRVAWMGMVTQAGVALGLTKTVQERFPEWGAEFAALLVSVIVLNQLLGPPMFKAALTAVGEGNASPGVGTPGGGGVLPRTMSPAKAIDAVLQRRQHLRSFLEGSGSRSDMA